ncbi:SDR family NAD(P)-dependent oxidoreductase [Streptomyces sp. NBC_00433]
MSKTIAVFGAGTGLGLGVARRFGQEGFRVALVARTQSKLDALRAELESEGIEADTFTQDLADHTALAGTVAAINERFGRIDVTEYSPAGITERPVATLDLDLAGLQPQLDVRLLAPIRLVNLVLPQMLERGDGALLFGLGAAGTNPLPMMSNVGIAFAGLRNYLKTLNESLAPKGIYAGGLTIGALIELSEAQRQFDGRPTSAQAVGFEPERVWPKDLAETFWDMYVKRDRYEDTIGTY